MNTHSRTHFHFFFSENESCVCDKIFTYYCIELFYYFLIKTNNMNDYIYVCVCLVLILLSISIVEKRKYHNETKLKLD